MSFSVGLLAPKYYRSDTAPFGGNLYQCGAERIFGNLETSVYHPFDGMVTLFVPLSGRRAPISPPIYALIGRYAKAADIEVDGAGA